MSGRSKSGRIVDQFVRHEEMVRDFFRQNPSVNQIDTSQTGDVVLHVWGVQDLNGMVRASTPRHVLDRAHALGQHSLRLKLAEKAVWDDIARLNEATAALKAKIDEPA